MNTLSFNSFFFKNINNYSNKGLSFSFLQSTNDFNPSWLNLSKKNIQTENLPKNSFSYIDFIFNNEIKGVEVWHFDYKHTNSTKTAFQKSINIITLPSCVKKYAFNDFLLRQSSFGMFSFFYTLMAKRRYYGSGGFKYASNEISPRLLDDVTFYKKRIALRIFKNFLNYNYISNIFIKSLRPIFYSKNKQLIGRVSLVSRYKKLFYKKYTKSYMKDMFWKGFFPLITLVKKTIDTTYLIEHTKITFNELIMYQNFRRHPSSQNNYINKNLGIGTPMESFFSYSFEDPEIIDHGPFYRLYWRYFKFKIEKFFYNQIHTRVHVWFLNIWDIFLNSIDALWRWFRYEDKATYFLTKKGQRFFIEDREDAKFYVRTLALTVTMVGGAKLFLDKISLMMKKHRNNWAFILHTAKSLRMCINYFWFRFFVNYKITLQGKIGGFLRAQKKFFKKGNISIENKESAITYYRGFPVTRFGSYNLSFWLQYRIPNLVEKFGDSEYVNTMGILLSMYSVPWLASRLAEIIKKMLLERAYIINRKLTQYSRRAGSRELLVYNFFKIKKLHFRHSILKPGNKTKMSEIRNISLGKNAKSIFNLENSLRKKIIKGIKKQIFFKKDSWKKNLEKKKLMNKTFLEESRSLLSKKM